MFVGDSIKMPRAFYSERDRRPFRICTMCRGDLYESMLYVIEKSYRRTKLLFEYALCWECLGAAETRMSYPSRKMRDYWLEKYVQIAERHARLSKIAPDDVGAWIDTCAVTGRPARALEEYQIMAHCDHDQLHLRGYPMMLSWDAVDQLQELLSKETREDWERFKRDYLVVPPKETVGWPTE